MGASLNHMQLIGHLGQDPEIRYTPTGKAVARLSVATNEHWTDAAGERQERTEWHRIVAWGKLAEICDKILAKGKQIYVAGRMQTRQWTDKDGATRYTTEIIANTVLCLSPRDPAAPDPYSGEPDPIPGDAPRYDDIPF